MNTKHLFLKLLCTVGIIAVYVIFWANTYLMFLLNGYTQWWMMWVVLLGVLVALVAAIKELWELK